jgi:sulfoxide reductase heme-binding subunit YedZ
MGLSIFAIAIEHSTALPSAGSHGTEALWYLTRTAAIAAYALLTLTAILGLLRSLARTARVHTGWVIWGVDELHQFSALLAPAFILLHLGSLLLDSYLSFSLANLLIPLGEPYRPLATDLGVLALYALVVVLGSSWLRQSFPYGTWRALHCTTFVAFVLVTAHGLLAGSDSGQPWMAALYLGASISVGILVLLRVVVSSTHRSAQVAPQPGQ